MSMMKAAVLFLRRRIRMHKKILSLLKVKTTAPAFSVSYIKTEHPLPVEDYTLISFT